MRFCFALAWESIKSRFGKRLRIQTCGMDCPIADPAREATVRRRARDRRNTVSQRKRNRKAKQWQEAQAKCGLSNEAVRMARELGMAPRSLIKNIPSQSQPWKASVEEWIRDLYQHRQARIARKKARREEEREEENTLWYQGMEMEMDQMERDAIGHFPSEAFLAPSLLWKTI